MGIKGNFKKSLFILFYSVVIFSLVFALLPVGFIYGQGEDEPVNEVHAFIVFLGSTNPDSDTCINLDLRDADSGGLLWKLTISDGVDIIKTLTGTGSVGIDSNGFATIGPLTAGTYTATLKLFETEQARDADTPYIAMDTRIFEIWEHTTNIGVSQGNPPDNVVFNMAAANSNGKYWFISLDRVNPENPNDITYIGKYCPSDFPGTSPTIDSNDWTLDVATGLEEGTYRATIWIGLNSNEADSNPEDNQVMFTVDANGNVVNNPPVAQASIDPLLAPVGTVFTFDGSASYDENGTIVSYDWDFGDGTTGYGETTTHVYTSAGTYTVTLTVTDNDGATDTDTAIVTVQTPEEATQDLITDIEELNLPGGIENSLTSKLGAAINSLNNGQENAAINKLNAFINQVEAQRGKKITDEQADELIAEAQRIIDNI